jgi:hypothetical protein
LKQIKQQGVSQAKYVGLDFAANKIADFRMADYLYKHEPLGIYVMKRKRYKRCCCAISLQRAMVDVAKESNKQMNVLERCVTTPRNSAQQFKSFLRLQRQFCEHRKSC